MSAGAQMTEPGFTDNAAAEISTAENAEKKAAAAAKGAKRFQKSRRLARRCALQLLYQLDMQQDWQLRPANLQSFWAQLQEMEELAATAEELAEARKFAEKLVQSAIENLPEIDTRLQALADNWSLERMNATDRAILRLGAAELAFTPGTPAKTAINEAIELSKEFGDKHSSRFVNGVLDRLHRG